MTSERCERDGEVIANTIVGRTSQCTGKGLVLLAPAGDLGRSAEHHDDPIAY